MTTAPERHFPTGRVKVTGDLYHGHIPDGSYSLGIVIGYQKDTAQDLQKDAAPGT
jgi:hypothetical protein